MLPIIERTPLHRVPVEIEGSRGGAWRIREKINTTPEDNTLQVKGEGKGVLGMSRRVEGDRRLLLEERV